MKLVFLRVKYSDVFRIIKVILLDIIGAFMVEVGKCSIY